MKTLRLAVFASVLAVLTGCPKGDDKCNGVQCPTGQSCDPGSGQCVNGNVGGGTGGNGGNGGNGGMGGGDAGPPLTLSEACAKVADARCSKLIRCQQLDAAQKATCVANDTATCTYEKDVAHGTSVFNGAAAAQCIAQLATQDCGDVDDSFYSPGLPIDPAICAGVTALRKGPAGAPCQVSAHCQTDAGLYCAINDYQTCRVCTSYVGPGSFCAYDVDIRCRPDPDLFCDENQDNLDGGHCRGRTQLGESCDWVDCQSDAGLFCENQRDGGPFRCASLRTQGQRCTASGNCQSSFFCNFPGDGGNFCDQRRSADQQCNGSIICAASLYCQRPPDGGTGLCKGLLGDGTSCTAASQCASSFCARLPTTGIDAGLGQCGYLTSMQDCWRHGDCGPGNFCKGYVPRRTDAGIVVGQCDRLSPDGGACVNVERISQTRVSDSCANPAETCLDGTCKTVRPFSRMLGETCDPTDPGYESPMCGNGTRCNYSEDPLTGEGHCVALLNDGEDCVEDNECQLGRYCDFFNTSTCVRAAHVGEVCDDSNGPVCQGTVTNPPAVTCNLVADGGTECGTLVNVGSACDTFDGPQCFNSFCDPDAGVCATRLANGTSCGGNGQCASGRCEADAGVRTCLMACY